MWRWRHGVLLIPTDLSVGTIADRLGFSEVTGFTKFFIRRVNTTPGAFRREHKGRDQA